MKLKRIIAGLLAVILCFMLCACDSDGLKLAPKKSAYEKLVEYIQENDESDDDLCMVRANSECAVVYDEEEDTISFFMLSDNNESETSVLVKFEEDDTEAEVYLTFEYIYKDEMWCTLDMETLDPDNIQLEDFEHKGKYTADSSSLATYKDYTKAVLSTLFSACEDVVEDADITMQDLGFENF